MSCSGAIEIRTKNHPPLPAPKRINTLASYTGHPACRDFVAAYHCGGKAGKFVFCPNEFEHSPKRFWR
jgi:hypothetical protein